MLNQRSVYNVKYSIFIISAKPVHFFFKQRSTQKLIQRDV